MRVQWVSAVALLGLMACSPAKVKGEVDGAPVPAAKSALYDELAVTLPIIGEMKFLYVIVTDIPDACDAILDLAASASLSCEESCTDLVAFNENYLRGDDYYLLNFTMNAGTDAVREYKPDAQLQQAGNFTASYASFDVSATSEQGTCVAACESGAGAIQTTTNVSAGGGALEITGYSEGERVKGNFDVGFGGDDALKGSFVAERCDLTSIFTGQ